jgi:hypothetical protein
MIAQDQDRDGTPCFPLLSHFESLLCGQRGPKIFLQDSGERSLELARLREVIWQQLSQLQAGPA